MQYITVPFDPAISRESPATGVASDLQGLIGRHAADGWEYVGVANHSTVVPGDSGCFGIGATQPYPKTLSIVVFKK
jgi:hypothetical protein